MCNQYREYDISGYNMKVSENSTTVVDIFNPFSMYMDIWPTKIELFKLCQNVY